MKPDLFTVKSFYSRVYEEFLDSADMLTMLYDGWKTPDQYEYYAAKNKLSRSTEKLQLVINNAKQYGYELGYVPKILVRGGQA